MENKIRVGLTIIALIVIFFLQRGCKPDDKPVIQKVVVPEQKGTFKEPTVIITHTGKKDSIVYRKGKTIYTENPFNEKLSEEFLKAQKENDSLKALTLYLNSIQEREETYIFDNKDAKIEVYIKTRGEILKITPTYTIKEREVEVAVKQKESKFALYAGASIESTTDLNKLVPKAIIGIQNAKGDILSAGIGTDKSFQVGYSFRLINIKK